MKTGAKLNVLKSSYKMYVASNLNKKSVKPFGQMQNKERAYLYKP